MKTFHIHPSIQWALVFGLALTNMTSLGRRFTMISLWIGPVCVTFQWVTEPLATLEGENKLLCDLMDKTFAPKTLTK